MKLGLAVLLLAVAIAAAASAPAAADAPVSRSLYTIGDSMAFDNKPYLRHQLRRWEIEDNFSFARTASDTAHDLRKRSAEGPPLPPVINVSAGTGDDGSRPKRFRTAIRRIMRVAGKHRCVVWSNIWRPAAGDPNSDVLNGVLAKEDAARKNLRVVDWHSMVFAHQDWLVDIIHVNAAGNRARAHAVADAVRACRSQLQ